MINPSSINFKGQFQIDKAELSKVPTMQKIKFLKQKDELIEKFCPSGDSYIKNENKYIINIKNEKESDFLKYLEQFGITAKRV